MEDGFRCYVLSGSDPKLDVYFACLERAFGRVLNLPAADSDNRIAVAGSGRTADVAAGRLHAHLTYPRPWPPAPAFSYP